MPQSTVNESRCDPLAGRVFWGKFPKSAEKIAQNVWANTSLTSVFPSFSEGTDLANSRMAGDCGKSKVEDYFNVAIFR
jgi:hypothetical protein